MPKDSARQDLIKKSSILSIITVPELPEIETIRLQLAQYITGLNISKITVYKEKSFQGNPKQLVGARITDLARFAKILIIETDKGLFLAVHLKMTGQLIFKKRGEKTKLPDKYTRVMLQFEGGSRLFFNDIRIFGWMRIIKDVTEITAKLGPDPFKLTTQEFHQILTKSGKPIKLLLMDQEKLAGVGNIYANESLFLAKINPLEKANRLARQKSDKLLNALIVVLKKGIKWGGASQNNYLNARGEKGQMQEHLSVYDCKDEPCPNGCRGKIKRIVMGGRGTFFCPDCQKV